MAGYGTRIFVDYKDNVWIAGNGGKDTQILKFTRNGFVADGYGNRRVIVYDADTGAYGKRRMTKRQMSAHTKVPNRWDLR